jgi:NADH:ubiquinone oxidoreductase subunit 2 (subunit N)
MAVAAAVAAEAQAQTQTLMMVMMMVMMMVVMVMMVMLQQKGPGRRSFSAWQCLAARAWWRPATQTACCACGTPASARWWRLGPCW